MFEKRPWETQEAGECFLAEKVSFNWRKRTCISFIFFNIVRDLKC